MLVKLQAKTVEKYTALSHTNKLAKHISGASRRVAYVIMAQLWKQSRKHAQVKKLNKNAKTSLIKNQ